MRIRVQHVGESGATSRAVLRQKATGLIAHPTRVAEGFRSHWASPPLRSLFSLAMQAPPSHTSTAGRDGRQRKTYFLLNLNINLAQPQGLLARQITESGPPPSPLAPSTNRIVHRDFEAVAAARHGATIAIAVAVALAAAAAVLEHRNRALVIHYKLRIVGKYAEASLNCGESVLVR